MDQNHIVDIIIAFIPVIMAVATYLINSHIKDKQLGVELDKAVHNSLGIVQQAISGTSVKRASSAIAAQVSDPLIAQGVQYVLDHAPDSVSRFNIQPQNIAEKIVARIGLENIKTNLATTASSGTAETVSAISPTSTSGV